MASVRVLLIVGLMGALIAWVVAPAVPVSGGGPPSAESSAARDATRAHTSDDAHARLNVELRRLHTSLASMPSPSTSRRDPFRFAGGGHGRSDTESEPTAATAGATGGETPQDRPPMQLLGIAEDGDPAAVERTAVIATPRQVYMVKEGDQIAFRFQVARIGADAVELRDLAHDATFTLALR